MHAIARLVVSLSSLLVAMTVATSASAERRALVIGNDVYAHIESLRNAGADAKAMASALSGAGFKVDPPVLNADRARMLEAISRFAEGLGQNDEVVVFYAGHAVELKGVNYLLPVDIRGDTERAVQFNAVQLNDLLTSVADQRPKFSMMVIDACRDNPFKGSGRNLNSRGLVPAGAAAAGQMVIYSASEGQKALDRLGPDDKSPNGVFTRVFVKVIGTPGLPVHEAMRQVKSEVRRLAEGVQHRQTPAVYDATEGEFYFSGPAGAGGKGRDTAPRRDADAETYEAADAAESMEALEHYLEAFPKGQYAAAARIRIAALRKATAPVAPPPDKYRDGQTFRDCATCPELVVIPGGSFEMGSAAGEAGRSDDEGPVRTVLVGRFGLGKTEVTRGEFRRFVSATGRSVKGCFVFDGKEWKNEGSKSWDSPGYAQTDEHPVVCVSWEDAQAYVGWLSRSSEKSYRLPSESEWEYGARAGTRSVRHWGDGEGEACRYANAADAASKRKYNWSPTFACDDGYTETAPVGSFQGNGFGLKDMLGNVAEWTQDCHEASYGGAPTDGSAVSGSNCARRAVRGGSWNYDPAVVRSAFRIRGSPTVRGNYLGFRIARTLP